MNTEAIHFIAKAILAQNTVLPNGERLKFDMKNWCGTACCIAGWTNVLITDDENARKDEHHFFSAERKLGLTRNQALELFSPALTIPYSEVTPATGCGRPIAPCGHRFSGLGGIEEPTWPAWSQSRGIPRVSPWKT